MLPKPRACSLCRLNYVSTGFCPDTQAGTPKFAIMSECPTKADILDEGYWRGSVGRWNEKRFLTPLGLTRGDILFSSVIRCKAPKGFPDGPLGKIGASCCRQYDSAMEVYCPDLAIATYGLEDVAKLPALFRLVTASLEKALRFVDRGFRPVVLMGSEAVRLVLPWTGGSVKKWAGTYAEINGWPFASQVKTPAELVEIEIDERAPWD